MNHLLFTNAIFLKNLMKNCLEELNFLKKQNFYIALYGNKDSLKNAKKNNFIDYLVFLDEKEIHNLNTKKHFTFSNFSLKKTLIFLEKHFDINLSKSLVIFSDKSQLENFSKINFKYILSSKKVEYFENVYYSSALEQNGIKESLVDFIYRFKLDPLKK